VNETVPVATPADLAAPASGIDIISIVAHASVTVQLVMFILLLASVISWYMIIRRWLALRDAQKAFTVFEDRFWSGIDLSRLFVQVNTEPNADSGEENIFRAGFKEFARLRKTKGVDAEGVMEGAQRAMRVAFAREQEKLEKNLPFLATVGSTSPYIGLFGTVWGIMNSFMALASVKQASIAVVAPHIAEALIATAMGLFAAIPAVIAYNRFTTLVDYLLHNYQTFSDEFTAILHRKAHSAEDVG